jgi:Sulfotransferase family
MKLIYLAGPSHSGSTLLDLMLNAHPEIVSVGEAVNLNRIRYRKSGKRRLEKCSCRAPSLLQCEFWQRVDKHLKETQGMGLRGLTLNNYSKRDEWHASNSAFFRSVSEISGKKFIVDSSKLPRRLSYLIQFDEFEVYPIHLVREPKGHVTSVMRKHGFGKSIFRYEFVHQQIRRRLKSLPHIVVRYEDLVLHPEGTLRRVLEPLGLEFDLRQLSWAEQIKHTVAGNRLRFQTTSELRLDERWKHRLSLTQKLAIDIGTLHSRLRIP